ncbi:MAG TPA: nitrophenyl compound nitroreductase subunit ArsF family protein [Bacteroidales bacterium]|nr:nitrophenyl compound nitroreductase subunit ArsF family protein [Bacteroidales bacterium]
MKKLCLLTILLMALSSTGFSQQPTISVYFFHGTHRCSGCINAEKATVAVLNSVYKVQQEKGIIKFQSINIEEDKNKALAEKYQVAWNTLLIVPVGNDKGKVDLTEQAFAYGENPEALKPYLTAAIEPLLK